MVISERLYGRTNQMTGPIDMLLQAVALALGVALVTGYWSGDGQQGIAGGGRTAG